MKSVMSTQVSTLCIIPEFRGTLSHLLVVVPQVQVMCTTLPEINAAASFFLPFYEMIAPSRWSPRNKLSYPSVQTKYRYRYCSVELQLQ